MAKRKKSTATPRQKLLGKRAAAYQSKLKTLRQILGGFDAQKYTTLQSSKPRTAAGRASRRANLQKVNRTFARLRPFVHRGYKLVKPGKRVHFESLRRHVGVTKFKKLRAIPLPTIAKRISVRFDKSGAPIIREDGVGQKVFLFPHIPRARFVGRGKQRRWIDAQADAQAMLADMLPKMPQGIYVLLSRHHFLIPTSTDREGLEYKVSRLYAQYGSSPEFLATFYGFRYMTDSVEQWREMKAAMLSERARGKDKRRRQKAARALKEILAMDKQLKAGAPLTRGQTTRREELQTMGEAPWQKKRREKISERAKKTGRR